MKVNETIPVLFVDSRSNYKQYSFTDCYDIDRNAFNYSGTAAVIAHPPCRLWGRMAYFSTAPQVERLLALWSIVQVRKNGGIFEHPAGSRVFAKMKIPRDGTPDQYGGYIVSIDQHWFGFKARKRTYLYILGCTKAQLPPVNLNFDAITHSVGTSRNLLELDKSKNAETTPQLCEWLFQIQQIIELNKLSQL